MRVYAKTKRSNGMSNKLEIVVRFGEELLALPATAMSMFVFQLAMVAR
jgi:hypothetical protein